jgi:hypothetical protein
MNRRNLLFCEIAREPDLSVAPLVMVGTGEVGLVVGVPPAGRRSDRPAGASRRDFSDLL